MGDDFLKRLPQDLRERVGEQYATAVRAAQRGYLDDRADEDALTGGLHAEIRSRVRGKGWFDRKQYEWWTYPSKFRGRGRGALEAAIGADGIITIKVKYPDGDFRSKSLVYQAKNNWNSRDQKLIKQLDTIDSHDLDGVLINYDRDSYTLISGKKVVAADGRPSDVKPSDIMRLDDALRTDFLACRIGDVHVRYDTESRVVLHEPPGRSPKRIAADHIVKTVIAQR